MKMRATTTKVKTLKRQRLIDLISLENIHSIITVKNCYGESLAIALKSKTSCGAVPRYGDPRSEKGGAFFIALDRFTYHLPYYVAMPADQYQDIVICHKELIQEDEEGVHSTVFIRAQITKPIKY